MKRMIITGITAVAMAAGFQILPMSSAPTVAYAEVADDVHISPSPTAKANKPLMPTTGVKELLDIILTSLRANGDSQAAGSNSNPFSGPSYTGE